MMLILDVLISSVISSFHFVLTNHYLCFFIGVIVFVCGVYTSANNRGYSTIWYHAVSQEDIVPKNKQIQSRKPNAFYNISSNNLLLLLLSSS